MNKRLHFSSEEEANRYYKFGVKMENPFFILNEVKWFRDKWHAKESQIYKRSCNKNIYTRDEIES